MQRVFWWNLETNQIEPFNQFPSGSLEDLERKFVVIPSTDGYDWIFAVNGLQGQTHRFHGDSMYHQDILRRYLIHIKANLEVWFPGQVSEPGTYKQRFGGSWTRDSEGLHLGGRSASMSNFFEIFEDQPISATELLREMVTTLKMPIKMATGKMPTDFVQATPKSLQPKPKIKKARK